MTRYLAIATLATLAGAAAALFWAFVKVGGDFRTGRNSSQLKPVEGDFEEAGW